MYSFNGEKTEMRSERGGFKPPEPVWEIIAEQEQREQAERDQFLGRVVQDGISAVADRFHLSRDDARNLFFSYIANRLMQLLPPGEDKTGEEYSTEGTDLDDPLGVLGDIREVGSPSGFNRTVADAEEDERRRGWIEEIMGAAHREPDFPLDRPAQDSDTEIAEILGSVAYEEGDLLPGEVDDELEDGDMTESWGGLR